MTITKILSDNKLSSGNFNPTSFLEDLDRHLNTTNQNISSLSQVEKGPNCLLMTKLVESKLLDKKTMLRSTSSPIEWQIL